MSGATEEFIALQDFLKLTGMVRSGGEAKVLIQGGEVRVDGLVETRRRRKLYGGERIELGGEQVTVERLGEG